MLVVFILKVKYKYKSNGLDKEGEFDHELCYVKKTSSLEFDNEYSEWFIIPTISISFNSGLYITIHWLRCFYINHWTTVTYQDENNYAEYRKNKNNEE